MVVLVLDDLIVWLCEVVVVLGLLCEGLLCMGLEMLVEML